ncbi:ATPase [Actinomadura sp. ATCC 31491]|uniref:ATPase n=1 Tax=Actinomadura luzonensis TaxID=2805427 RepID=A0ABT0G4R2_9ACTN|nr:BadF/BadG/BcrA/BcrD ATPase family protein [Actinomadura luzonensis]MCK2219587.1 ATPase [Actinomadura luzonensis]
MAELVLGVDAGGTSSRAALFTMDGTPLGRGRAAGANPVTLGQDAARAALTAAVRAALGDASDQVSAVVVGLAGNPARCLALAREVFAALLPGGPPVRVVGDVVTAFAAGTASPSGAVLISGTGAIAAKITDHAVTATADGYGWLLGDEGSAFWLGHAAARHAVRALDGPRPLGALARLVVTRLAGEGEPAAVELGAAELGAEELGAEELAAAVYGRAPLALAELAPLVGRAAEAGDPAALAIVAEAARLLARTAGRVREPGLPVVLAGGVLTTDGPVRRAVRDLLNARRDGRGDVVVAGDPAGAAAWLAARPLLGPHRAARLHRRFTAPPADGSVRP